jgi:hypothetical protein
LQQLGQEIHLLKLGVNMNEKSTSHFGVSPKGDAIKNFNVFFAYIEAFLEIVGLEGNLN